MSADRQPYGDEPGFGRGVAPLYNLVYCSRASPGVGDADVERILATARRANPEHGITGMLVFGSGIFFQWLEGPRDNVLALMNLLRADARHCDVVQITEVEEVLFPDWAMELVTAEHIREVLEDALASASDPQNARILARLLAEIGSGDLGSLGST